MKTLQYNYITSRLQGRTGNMMFQIAHGFVKSLEYNRQFIVPSEESSSKHLEKNLFRKLDFLITKIPPPETSKHIWGSFTYDKVDEPSNEIPTVYAGWYQSEKFFGNYSQVIRDLYSPTYEFIQKAINDFPFLKDSVVTALNVRRGDYLTQPTRHPVITTEYINEAYKQLPSHDKLIIMSDDIEWCKTNINLPNSVFIEPNKYWDHEGIWLLSLCHHFIISNSTFSWWGSWLSKFNNKVVVSPSIWFGPDVIDNPKDIWCDDWIKIPTYFKNGFICLTT
ncbi:MAG: alpha-1,2-fucosyltransferase [Gammaproteobacteria bacterium]|nr:alpha-1,2-fucosyltransferase [Gammaproteobacteria bacterium]